MANGCKKRKPGRPRKSIRRVRLNITLHPSVLEEAGRLAFETQRSLSNLIERELIQLINERYSDSSNLPSIS
jgi:hypothetical protein